MELFKNQSFRDMIYAPGGLMLLSYKEERKRLMNVNSYQFERIVSKSKQKILGQMDTIISSINL